MKDVLGVDNVPDLRGEFIRGWDHGKGTDTGRDLLSTQDQEIQSHNHAYNRPGFISYNSSSGYTTYANSESTQNTGDTGGTETRPRNVALMYIIYNGA